MKKKLTAIALVICLMAVAVIGGSLAYFTDTAKAENNFTTGNVDIEVNEVFKEGAKLIPGVDVQKEVRVENKGSEPAYVRVHIAFPKILDSGSPEFAAYKNTLHWNFTGDSVQNGQWSQMRSSSAEGPNSAYPNWPGNGGEYNSYEATIGGVDYTVYVITYESVLAAGETTKNPAISKVYLDTKVTQDDLAKILGEIKEIKVLVFAEGGQAATFTDAFVALNTQFGDPMSAGYVAPWNK